MRSVIEWPPRCTTVCEAKTWRAEFQPAMSSIGLDATLPAIQRVMPRFAPCRTKNMLRLVRKLGSLVRTSSRPLTRPSSSVTTSASSTPTHTLRLSVQVSSAAARPAEVTSTPADRSYSPPISSMAIGTAIMPMVEAW